MRPSRDAVLAGRWNPLKTAIRVLRRAPVVQYGVHLRDNRHLDAVLGRELEDEGARPHTFGHHLHPRQDILQLPTPGQLDSDVPVAAEGARAVAVASPIPARPAEVLGSPPIATSRRGRSASERG